MAEIPKIYLLLETSRGFGRGLLRGVIRWTRLHGSYLLVGSAGHFEEELPKIPLGEKAGIIATISSVKQCELLRTLNLPLIAVEPAFEQFMQIYRHMEASTITVNEIAVSTEIANYFLNKGYINFAYCGIPNNLSWSEARRVAFVEHIHRNGYECAVYPCPYKPHNPFRWRRDSEYLAKWLHALPHPTALMACNDDRGRHILEVCQQEGISVPRHVSVIGVDDDDLICDLTLPPLSSVALDVQTGGFQIMEQMNGLLTSSTTRHKKIYIDPLYVFERQSSDFYAFDDPLIAEAMRFIKDNYLFPICVSDVVRATKVSRRTLERKFLEMVGITIYDEISNRRFERAQQLLLGTKQQLLQVAISSGFTNFQQMLRIFREKRQCTPSDFRHGHQSLQGDKEDDAQ